MTEVEPEESVRLLLAEVVRQAVDDHRYLSECGILAERKITRQICGPRLGRALSKRDAYELVDFFYSNNSPFSQLLSTMQVNIDAEAALNRIATSQQERREHRSISCVRPDYHRKQYRTPQKTDSPPPPALLVFFRAGALADTRLWPVNNSAARWGARKIHYIENLMAAKDSTSLTAMDVVPKSVRPNKYQTAVYSAWRRALDFVKC